MALRFQPPGILFCFSVPKLEFGLGLPDATVKNPKSSRQNPENPGIFPLKSGKNPERFLA